jgi:alkylhydroperoxidase family enzyme
MTQDAATALPRTSFENLPPLLQNELRAKFERLGYLGEFFQVCASQPDALYHFNRFTEVLKAALPGNLVELLALTLSIWSGNRYEQVQHERLALKSGLSKDWVVAAEQLDPDGAGALSDVEKDVQRLALAMAKTLGRDAHAELAALCEHLSPELRVAVLLTVGRYIAHSTICNTLQFAAPVASPLGAD